MRAHATSVRAVFGMPQLMPTVAVLLMALELLVASVAAVPVALPGCPEACGRVHVPYPFGFRQGCFHKGFNLTCDETAGRPPRLLLDDGLEVDAISLADGTVRVEGKTVSAAFADNLTIAKPSLNSNGSWSAGLAVTGGQRLAVSVERNIFVAYGCNFIAYLVADPDPAGSSTRHTAEYVSACAPLCGNNFSVTEQETTSCARGCCQTSIAWGQPAYGVQFRNLDQTDVKQQHRFVAAFIVDREWFTGVNLAMTQTQLAMISLSYESPRHGLRTSPDDDYVISVPTVLDWWLDVEGDSDLVMQDEDRASGWKCISLNSRALNVGQQSNRVRCKCSDGYEGNPYVPQGCQDIDECRHIVYPCPHGTCINMPGTYRCSSDKSSSGSLRGFITIIAISSGFGLLFSLLGVAKITHILKQRRAMKLRQKFFRKNHGLLLQQLISSNKDIAERMRIFSLEELEQATNKFDYNRILGGGGHGTVYKGILSDQRIVAIKKAKIVVQREIDHFINEVVILSQTNHRNVVKLFGCCLETEVPLLVYEFISNGTLSFHLHAQTENPLSWKDRLRIALETARAIGYLHSAASISVYHRDIKCANILLTDTLTSKLSDFGASRSIAIEETGILTAVQGTYGYLDPEYYYTGRLTEKSDVYSFGVILAELMTRLTPVFSSESSEGTSLASYFVSLTRENRLLDILDAHIVEEGGAQEAEVVARLAEACLSLKGEERPTMRQVETALEDVQNSKVNLSSQEKILNLDVINGQLYNGSKGGEGTRLYSLEKQFIQSSEIPR